MAIHTTYAPLGLIAWSKHWVTGGGSLRHSIYKVVTAN